LAEARAIAREVIANLDEQDYAQTDDLPFGNPRCGDVYGVVHEDHGKLYVKFQICTDNDSLIILSCHRPEFKITLANKKSIAP